MIKNTTGRDIPIAVTEMNSCWSHAVGGEATPDSFYNAIWYADVLGRLIRQQVAVAVYFDLQSRTDSFGLLIKYDVRPSYYVYPMYGKLDSKILSSQSTVGEVTSPPPCAMTAP